MKFLFATVMVLGLSGCGTLVSSEHFTTRTTTDMKRTCGCGGNMAGCMKNPDGSTCCSKESCGCSTTAKK